jgi:hypothetical protein
MKKYRHLTSDQVLEARRLWAAGASRGEIAIALGITLDTLRAREADQLSDLPPRVRTLNSGRRGELPDEATIAARCAMLRRTWPDERFMPAEEHGERLGRMAERAAF